MDRLGYGEGWGGAPTSLALSCPTLYSLPSSSSYIIYLDSHPEYFACYIPGDRSSSLLTAGPSVAPEGKEELVPGKVTSNKRDAYAAQRLCMYM